MGKAIIRFRRGAYNRLATHVERCVNYYGQARQLVELLDYVVVKVVLGSGNGLQTSCAIHVSDSGKHISIFGPHVGYEQHKRTLLARWEVEVAWCFFKEDSRSKGAKLLSMLD